MSKYKFLPLSLFLAAAVFAGPVFAQKTVSTPVKAAEMPLISLKALPEASRYTDLEKTFTIWMPATPKSVSMTPPADPLKGSTKTQIKWDVVEGFFAVTRSVFEHRTFDTDKELQEYLSVLKASVGATPEVKFVSEKALTREKWRGADLTYMSGDWIKSIVRVLASGNVVYVVSVTIDLNAPDGEKLSIKALDSLKPAEKVEKVEKAEKAEKKAEAVKIKVP